MAKSPKTPERGRGPAPAEVIALVLSVGWMLVVGTFFVVLPPTSGVEGFDSLRFVLTVLAVFMPVAMIWVTTMAARAARVMREESQRLQVAIDGMRQTYLTERGKAVEPTVEKKLNEIAQATRKTETALATFASSRDPRAKPVQKSAPVEDQPRLALGTQSEETAPPLMNLDLIRALNFPDTEQDKQGFAALHRALKDRNARQLVQASQDVLTLLSQDGIYMDDLRPERSRPELWRRFAQGERGAATAALGGIRDRSSLALTAGRMREDTIFRDAAHHFLRKFDQMIQAFEPHASDEELIDLADTRTARAFMLLGRVTGAFD